MRAWFCLSLVCSSGCLRANDGTERRSGLFADVPSEEASPQPTSTGQNDPEDPVDDQVVALSTMTFRDTCSEWDDGECVSRVIAFTIDAPSNAAIEAACQRAGDRDDGCAESTIGTACDIFSRVEREAVVAVYDCYADTACDEDATSCHEELGTLAFAERVQSQCPDVVLDEMLLTALDLLAPWMKPEVLDDIQICATLCERGGFEECVVAWTNTVLGAE